MPSFFSRDADVSNGLADGKRDLSGNLVHAQRFRPRHCVDLLLMTWRGQQEIGCFRDVRYIHGDKLRVLQREEEGASGNNCGRFPQVLCHELAWPEMRPGDSGTLSLGLA